MGSIRRIVVVAGAVALLLAASLPAFAGVPPAPTATADAYSVDEDGTLTPSPGVLENDNPGANTCVTAYDTTGMTGSLESSNEDGSFTYKPPSNFNGETSFSYGIRADDGGAEGCAGPADSTATVTITVDPVNDAPTATADSFVAVMNQTLNVGDPGVLANDNDIDGDSLTASKVSNPAHGVVTLSADGGFSYTPASGYTGPDAFSYRASDGSANSPTRVVSLSVTALPPVHTPTPAPTATPTPPPTATPEPTPSETPAASQSAAPSDSPAPTASASAAPSPSPAASSEPSEPVSGDGGPPLLAIAALLLLVSLLAVAAGFYMRSRGAEGDPDDGPDLDRRGT